MGEVTVPSMEEEAITALPEQDTGTGNVGLIWEAAISDAAGSFDYNFLDLIRGSTPRRQSQMRFLAVMCGRAV